MYQSYFKLTCAPFGLTPDTHFFCHSEQHISALNTTLLSLEQGEGFIKITGEVGSGKTLLCRLLLNELNKDRYVTAYLPNPTIRPEELPKILAKEIGVDTTNFPTNTHDAQEILYKKLMSINESGKSTVFLIDEAQAMPIETLEALRLLTNLEAETHKLLQIILLGQPELNDKLNRPELRQLKQRIAFSDQLDPLTKPALHAYIRHRLAIAGHTQGNLFTEKAMNLIFRYSAGIPRVANILCHKALIVSYGLGHAHVTSAHVNRAKRDTEFACGYKPQKSSLQQLGQRIVNLFSVRQKTPS